MPESEDASSEASSEEEALPLPSRLVTFERSILFAKEVNPLITEPEVSSVTRLLDPVMIPAAKSL